MYVQGVDDVYALRWNPDGVSYGDVYHENERQQSAYNFDSVDPAKLTRRFDDSEEECTALLAAGLALPAYEQCIRASHAFNQLDARGAIGVAVRAGYILRVRAMAAACCGQWMRGVAPSAAGSPDA